MKGRRRGESGAASVEFALLIIPLLIPVLAGVVDLGTAMVVRAQLQEAAQEGVSVVSREPTQTGLARARAIESVSAVQLQPDQVDISCEAPSGRPRVSITHELDTMILQIVMTDSVTVSTFMVADRLTSQACQQSVLP